MQSQSYLELASHNGFNIMKASLEFPLPETSYRLYEMVLGVGTMSVPSYSFMHKR